MEKRKKGKNHELQSPAIERRGFEEENAQKSIRQVEIIAVGRVVEKRCVYNIKERRWESIEMKLPVRSNFWVILFSFVQ